MIPNQRQIYRLKNGTLVPGVTTITGEQLGWNKKILMKWSNNKGLEGINTAEYVDNLADIGKLGHRFVTDSLLGRKTDTDNYSKNQIDKAENCAFSFFEWAKKKTIRPILIEYPLVSEKYRYGGTQDIYAKINGSLELVDLKTGKGIWPDMIIQVGGGYFQLLNENGYHVDKVRILNIPRSNDEKFNETLISKKQCIIAKAVFLNCLSNHRHKKLLGV